jgi:hypothetical protein
MNVKHWRSDIDSRGTHIVTLIHQNPTWADNANSCLGYDKYSIQQLHFEHNIPLLYIQAKSTLIHSGQIYTP